MAPTKRLVVFSDGTWVGRETHIAGAPYSNIRMMADMVGKVEFPSPEDSDDPSTATAVHPIKTSNPNIIAGYQEGVGINQTFLSYLWNGATANNIDRECISIYEYIVNHFTDEHEIWMFGFSRGAFTVRCVAGMINNCGIIRRSEVLDKDIPTLCDEVYRTYRSNYPIDHPNSARCKELRRSERVWQVDQPVRFMGLIDTVGSLGIPALVAGTGFDWPAFEFHDQTCSSVVQNVYHAVCLHERLWILKPCLIFPSKKARTKIVQRWFPGCHQDAGRQAFRFLRQRPWNWIERLLSVLPNLLSKTVWPNEVLADVILRWILDAVQETEENGTPPASPIFPSLGIEIKTLTKRITTPKPSTLGTGDISTSPLTSLLPFGNFTEPLQRLISVPFKLLDSMFPRVTANISDPLGVKAIINALTGSRDRRVAKSVKTDSSDKIVYQYWSEEPGINEVGRPVQFIVGENARMGPKDLNSEGKMRYTSKAFETFETRLKVFGW